jgi:hypothetical protein
MGHLDHHPLAQQFPLEFLWEVDPLSPTLVDHPNHFFLLRILPRSFDLTYSGMVSGPATTQHNRPGPANGVSFVAGYYEPLPNSLHIAILLLPLTSRIADESALSEMFSAL